MILFLISTTFVYLRPYLYRYDIAPFYTMAKIFITSRLRVLSMIGVLVLNRQRNKRQNIYKIIQEQENDENR